MPEPLLNVDDYARAAEARLDPGVFGYVVGGADDEWTLRENRAAFRRWILRPRMLVDVSRVTTASSGFALSSMTRSGKGCNHGRSEGGTGRAPTSAAGVAS